MNINITAKKFDLTPTIREHIEERMENLSRFFDDKITESRAVLEVDDGHHRHGRINGCEVVVRIPGQKDVFVREWTEDMHKAINQVMDEVERELKERKDKITQLNNKELRRLKEGGVDEVNSN